MPDFKAASKNPGLLFASAPPRAACLEQRLMPRTVIFTSWLLYCSMICEPVSQSIVAGWLWCWIFSVYLHSPHRSVCLPSPAPKVLNSRIVSIPSFFELYEVHSQDILFLRTDSPDACC